MNHPQSQLLMRLQLNDAYALTELLREQLLVPGAANTLTMLKLLEQICEAILETSVMLAQHEQPHRPRD